MYKNIGRKLLQGFGWDSNKDGFLTPAELWSFWADTEQVTPVGKRVWQTWQNVTNSSTHTSASNTSATDGYFFTPEEVNEAAMSVKAILDLHLGGLPAVSRSFLGFYDWDADRDHLVSELDVLRTMASLGLIKEGGYTMLNASSSSAQRRLLWVDVPAGVGGERVRIRKLVWFFSAITTAVSWVADKVIAPVAKAVVEAVSPAIASVVEVRCNSCIISYCNFATFYFIAWLPAQLCQLEQCSKSNGTDA